MELNPQNCCPTAQNVDKITDWQGSTQITEQE